MFENLNFLEILILVLLGLLFFKEQMSGVFKTWFNGKFGSSEENVPGWASELLQHFNHDTTAQHDLTHEKLDSISRTVEMNSKKLDEHNKLEQVNSNKLDEIIKYGVKCN